MWARVFIMAGNVTRGFATILGWTVIVGMVNHAVVPMSEFISIRRGVGGESCAAEEIAASF
jgi:hypothetical protein